MPKISVIIPIYNVEKYLERCLDSVCNQTLKDIEIICIDDCSTDNSLKILEKYTEKDNRVKIIKLEEKQNAAIARNKGLEIAQGEYFGFVDSDDYIDTDFYEKLCNKACVDNADIVKGNIFETTAAGELISGVMNNDIINANDKMWFFSEWWSGLYKKDLIVENNIQFPIECPKSHDIVFLARCMVKCKKLSLVNDVYYHYIRRIGSLDQPKLSFESATSAIRACRMICDTLNEAADDEITVNGYLYAYIKRLTRFIHLYYVNDDARSKKYAVTSFLEYFHKMKYKTDAKKCSDAYNSNYLFSLLENGDEDLIEKELASCRGPKDFSKRNFLYNIRRNIKKDVTHA